MKKKIFYLLIAIMIIALVGCNEKYEFDTLSGKPETIVFGVEKDKIVNTISDEMIKQGYAIHDITEYKLVYEKDTDSTTAIFYGSDYNSTPKYRITINLVEYRDENKIRVIASIEIVTNPHSSHEKTTDITYSESGEKYYDILQNIKNKLEIK